MSAFLRSPWTALARWNPVENYSSVRSGDLTESFWQSDWLWVLVGLAGLVVVATVGLWLLLLNQSRKRWKAFDRHAKREQLTEQERRVLARLAKLARLRIPEVIFSSQSLFDIAELHLEEHERVRSLSPKARARLKSVCDSLRKKLRFMPLSSLTRETLPTERLQAGIEGTLRTLTTAESVAVRIAQVNGKLLTLEPRGPTPFKSAELCALRCEVEGKLWECQSPVKRRRRGLLEMQRPTALRLVNQRRYPRALVRRIDHLWCSVAESAEEGAEPSLAASQLIELGGPGLLVETSLPLENDRDVLVEVRHRNDLVASGRGVVRRSRPGREGKTTAAIELLSLPEDQRDLLVAITEKLAERNGGSARAEPADRGPQGARAEPEAESPPPEEKDRWKTPSKGPNEASVP